MEAIVMLMILGMAASSLLTSSSEHVGTADSDPDEDEASIGENALPVPPQTDSLFEDGEDSEDEVSLVDGIRGESILDRLWPSLDGSGEGTTVALPELGGSVILGGESGEVIVGSEGDDTISSGIGSDTVYGAGGDDIIDGRANLYREMDGGSYDWFNLVDGERDVIYGGSGHDTLGLADGDEGFGGASSDVFIVYSNEEVALSDLPVIMDFDPTLDRIQVTIELASGEADDKLGPYRGGGEFDFRGDVTFQRLEDVEGTVVVVDGTPRAIVLGSVVLDTSDVELRAFLRE